MTIKTKLPPQLGFIHFIGIGGIGMSGIAEVLITHGYQIQGSDLKASKILIRLQKIGVKVFLTQEAKKLN
jgi:UDP-N-acetylmuramate--alanine ligase